MILSEKDVTAGVLPTAIEGVALLPLKEIATEGGPVLHILRHDTPLFQGFGEIYCSVVEPGAVKAWKRHKRQTQLFSVPMGCIEVVLFDMRKNSPSQGTLLRVILGRPNHYQLLRIPYGIWYGFTARSEEDALVVNCVDIPHDPEEAERLDKDSDSIPYRWEA